MVAIVLRGRIRKPAQLNVQALVKEKAEEEVGLIATVKALSESGVLEILGLRKGNEVERDTRNRHTRKPRSYRRCPRLSKLGAASLYLVGNPKKSAMSGGKQRDTASATRLLGYNSREQTKIIQYLFFSEF